MLHTKSPLRYMCNSQCLVRWTVLLWRPSKLNDITQQSTNGLLLLYDASILHINKPFAFVIHTAPTTTKPKRSPKSRKIGFADEIRSRDSDPCSFSVRPLSLFVRYCWSGRDGAIQHSAAANTKRLTPPFIPFSRAGKADVANFARHVSANCVHPSIHSHSPCIAFVWPKQVVNIHRNGRRFAMAL